MVLATDTVVYPAATVGAAVDNGLRTIPAATATCHPEHWCVADSRTISDAPIS